MVVKLHVWGVFWGVVGSSVRNYCMFTAESDGETMKTKLVSSWQIHGQEYNGTFLTQCGHRPAYCDILYLRYFGLVCWGPGLSTLLITCFFAHWKFPESVVFAQHNKYIAPLFLFTIFICTFEYIQIVMFWDVLERIYWVLRISAEFFGHGSDCN